MSLRLETSVGTPLVRAALAVAMMVASTVAMLALSPAAAEAQTSAPTEDKGAPTVVVRPGDSLWSISEERLGPNASPRRVMKGAERIHELNRARIGADPGLIFVGQEFSLPPAMSGPPNGATVPAREAAEASGSDPRDRAAKGPAGKEAPREAAGRGAIPRSEISLEEAAEMLGADTAGKEALPEPRAAAPVPAVRAVATKGAPFELSADAQMEERRLLGLGIVVLTLLVVALVAWKLAMTRTTREDAERWGTSSGYYGETSPSARTSPFAYHPGPLGKRDASKPASAARRLTPPTDGPTNAGAASEDRSDRIDLFAVARAKRERVRRKQPPEFRRQSPRLRVRGLRWHPQTRSQRRPLSGHRRVTARARHEEWEPSTALRRALEGLPMGPETGNGEHLARLKPHLKEALGTLRRLERQRGLSGKERTREEAARALLAAIERGE